MNECGIPKFGNLDFVSDKKNKLKRIIAKENKRDELNRIENENRHPVHISGFDGYESLKYYIEKGREQKTFGRVIEISANDFAYQADEKLLEKIDNFMGLQYENH